MGFIGFMGLTIFWGIIVIMMNENLPDSEITYSIIGCAMRVHSELKNGFQEVIYQRALEKEMFDSSIAFSREHDMPIYYKNTLMGTRRVDFLVEGRISVELKALIKLEDVHIAQALNYLEAYNIPVGLLINFGASSLQYHRLFNKKSNPNNPTNPMNHGSDSILSPIKSIKTKK